MPTRAEAASQIWPHLPKTAAEPQAQRRERSLLAESMYPAHVKKPPSPLDQRAESLRRHLRELNDSLQRKEK
jgi:hypothetical protein